MRALLSVWPSLGVLVSEENCSFRGFSECVFFSALVTDFPRLDYSFGIHPVGLIHCMCVRSLQRPQGCMFGSDPSEMQDSPEGIFRDRVGLVCRILEEAASEALMRSPLPHGSCTVEDPDQPDSLLSVEGLEPPRYTTSYVQCLTDARVVFSVLT